MRQKKIRAIISYIALAVLVLTLKANVSKAPVGESVNVTMSRKDKLFEVAFSAMQAKADELGIKGVGMAALLITE